MRFVSSWSEATHPCGRNKGIVQAKATCKMQWYLDFKIIPQLLGKIDSKLWDLWPTRLVPSWLAVQLPPTQAD